jgi:hypothetical protein
MKTLCCDPVQQLTHGTSWSSGNFLDFYSGCTWFQFRKGQLLFWMRFLIVFLSTSRKMPGIMPWLIHDNLLSNPIQFVVTLSFYVVYTTYRPPRPFHPSWFNYPTIWTNRSWSSSTFFVTSPRMPTLCLESSAYVLSQYKPRISLTLRHRNEKQSSYFISIRIYFPT